MANLHKQKRLQNKELKMRIIMTKIFLKLHQITIPPRPKGMKIVYHLYVVFVENRDELLNIVIKKY